MPRHQMDERARAERRRRFTSRLHHRSVDTSQGDFGLFHTLLKKFHLNLEKLATLFVFLLEMWSVT